MAQYSPEVETDTDPLAVCSLDPPGPVGVLGGPHQLALLEGTLAAELVGDRVVVWIEVGDGDRVLTMWPGEYRARLQPLELQDERGVVVVRGGELVRAGGGYLPDTDPRGSGGGPVFSVSRTMPEPMRSP